jgi:hypothetical protein
MWEEDKVVGVGVVGYGYWGPNLARNFAEAEAAQLVAVCVQANLPIRRRTRGIVRSAALRSDAFSLLNGISIGFRSGEYWGR